MEEVDSETKEMYGSPVRDLLIRSIRQRRSKRERRPFEPVVEARSPREVQTVVEVRSPFENQPVEEVRSPIGDQPVVRPAQALESIGFR